jgi:hypothetical protein
MVVLVLAGCTPKIGDKCVLSTDCSTSGDRLCDVTQPGGYCTQFNCIGNKCPDQAACVIFESAVPGCAYSDRGVPRTGRQFCVAQCHQSSDCRAGYVCADPRNPPWNALILDDDQNQLTCMVDPLASFDTSSPDAGVCQTQGPSLPPVEAGAAPTLDAGTASDAGDAGADAGSDAGQDGGALDAGDGGVDASDGG